MVEYFNNLLTLAKPLFCDCASVSYNKDLLNKELIEICGLAKHFVIIMFYYFNHLIFIAVC